MTGRLALERALRTAAIVLLAVALWYTTRAPVNAARSIEGERLERELPSLVASPVSSVHVSFEELPAPATRDALAAISRAGTRVTWTGASLAPLAVTADRVREPSAPVRIVVTSNGDVELRDALTVLDTVHASAGATLEVSAPVGVLTASAIPPTIAPTAAAGSRSANARRTRTPATLAAASTLKPVLLLGAASWESKFTIAALEEAGWIVETRLTVAPAADVTQGKLAALDTSRYAAVIALDSTFGASATALPRFVHDGGGLVLVGDAASVPATRALAPAKVGVRINPVSRDLATADPWRALALRPLESLRPDAVRLASRDVLTTIAARREGAGRVVQVGYDEIWRWRMQGTDESGAAYRAWWSRLVAGVVSSPVAIQRESSAEGARVAIQSEGAPLARLISSLGPPSVSLAAPSRPSGIPPWLLPLVLAILLAEWTSRRLRGAR